MTAQLIATTTQADSTNNPWSSLVGVASDGTALAVYYDGADDRYVFRTASSPYSSWSAKTDLGGVPRMAGTLLMNNDDSAWFAYKDAGTAHNVVKLTKSGSTWTIGTPHATGQSGTGFRTPQAHILLKDGSGRLWSIASEDNTHWSAYYSGDGVTWTQSLGSQAIPTTAWGVGATICGNYLLVVYANNDGTAAWRRLDTTGALGSGNWSAAQTAVMGPSGGQFYAGDRISLATDGNNKGILVVSTSDFNFHSGVYAMTYTPGSDTWGTAVQIGTNTGAGTQDTAATAIAANGDVYALYCQYAGSANNYALVYKKWSKNGASWDSSATTLQSATTLLNPTGAYNGGKIVYEYAVGTASPYSVEFDYLQLSTHVTHTASGVSLQARTRVQHTARGVTIQMPSVHQTHTTSGVALDVAKIPPLFPIVSLGQPSYGSTPNSFNPQFANDADPSTSFVNTDTPTVGTPQWWAVDLSAVPVVNRGAVVLAWYNDGGEYYQPDGLGGATYFNEPRDYTIQANAAAGGGAPPGGGWVTLATVTGNVLWERQHALDLTGYNWVRFQATAINGSASNMGLRIQVDIHDAHRGNIDNIMMLGDSITAGAFVRRPASGGSWPTGTISQMVNASNPAFYPALLAAGDPFQGMAYGITNWNALIAGFTGHYIAINYGANDLNQNFQYTAAQYRAIYLNLLTLIDNVTAYGGVAIVPKIHFGTANGSYFGINALLFNEYVDRHLPYDRPNAVRGPDLWTPYWKNPALLSDGLHPTYPSVAGVDAGYDVWHRVWHAWLMANIYQTPRGVHTATGVSIQVTAAVAAKLHQYHVASGVTMQVQTNTVHHTANGITIQARQHVTHTASGVSMQVKTHKAHTASGVSLQVKQHTPHTATGVAILARRHNTHTATGVTMQVSFVLVTTVSRKVMVMPDAGRVTLRVGSL